MLYSSTKTRSPFTQYLTEGILSQKHSERYKLKRLATRYFLHNVVLFKKGYDGDPLRCLGPEEAKGMIKEVHLGECGEQQGKKKLHKCLQQMDYYWPTMKKDMAEFVKKYRSCQVQANLIHTHPQKLHNMVTPWPFHNWGLDLVGPVNPPSHGYIWILVATEYFIKWAKVVPLRKAMGGAVTNFIKENIIVRFEVPHRVISDNGTPFVNSEVRKMLEFYQIKHHRSSPYYPQGNGQVEATNKTLIKIINKISQEYTGRWAMHLPDAL